jgi:hypothetical protein
MRLSLPSAPAAYDMRDQAEVRRAIEQAQTTTQATNEDIIIVERRLILISPDGGQWSVTVDNSGNLETTAL